MGNKQTARSTDSSIQENPSSRRQTNAQKWNNQKRVLIDNPSRWKSKGLCSPAYPQEEVDNEWLNHLKSECEDLIDTCGWCAQVLASLRTYKGYPVDFYQQQLIGRLNRGSAQMQEQENTSGAAKKAKSIHRTPQQSGVRKKPTNIPSSRAQSNTNVITNNGVTQYQQSNENPEEIKRLIKKSELIEFNESTDLLSFKVNLSPMQISSSINNNRSFSGNNFGGVHHNNNQTPSSGSFSRSYVDNSFNSAQSDDPSYAYPQYQLQRRQFSAHTNEAVEALEQYVIKCERIADHLNDKNHVLGHVHFVFRETFKHSYQAISERLLDLRMQSQEFEKSESEDSMIKKAVSDVQQFIRVMQETLMLFYSFNHMHLSTHFTRENILNFVTSQVFKDNEIYSIVFSLLRLDDLQMESQLRAVMKVHSDKQPEDFYINDKLCLNGKTLSYYNKSIGQKNRNDNPFQVETVPETIIASDESTPQKAIYNRNEEKESEKKSTDENSCLNLQWQYEDEESKEIQSIDPKQLIVAAVSPSEKEHISQNKNKVNENEITTSQRSEEKSLNEQNLDFTEELKKSSYFKSMKCMLRIAEQQSPIGKMKMLLKASEGIITCINQFYSKHGIVATPALDADDVLSIFSYFSLKCFVYQMNTHINFISKFITGNLLNSVSGYYLTTLTASLQNLLDWNPEELLLKPFLDESLSNQQEINKRSL